MKKIFFSFLLFFGIISSVFATNFKFVANTAYAVDLIVDDVFQETIATSGSAVYMFDGGYYTFNNAGMGMYAIDIDTFNITSNQFDIDTFEFDYMSFEIDGSASLITPSGLFIITQNSGEFQLTTGSFDSNYIFTPSTRKVVSINYVNSSAPAPDTTFDLAVVNSFPIMPDKYLNKYEIFEINGTILNILTKDGNTSYALNIVQTESNVSKYDYYTTAFVDDFFGNSYGFIKVRETNRIVRDMHVFKGAYTFKFEPVNFLKILSSYLDLIPYSDFGTVYLNRTDFTLNGEIFKLYVRDNKAGYKRISFRNRSLGSISFNLHADKTIQNLKVRTKRKKAVYLKNISI